MIINNNSKILHFEPQKINSKEIYIPSNHLSMLPAITKIDDKYYYIKSVKPKGLINELIGSNLSKKIELNSVDYKIGICDNSLYALSEVFFEPNYSYSYCYDKYNTTAIEMYLKKRVIYERYYLSYLKMLKNINNKEMLLQILKLILIDLKMGQTDRNDHNIMLKTDNETNETTLASIYDFEESYEERPSLNEKYYYDNSFIILRKNFLSLFMFLQHFPFIKEYLKTLCDISILQVLDEIEKEFQIEFHTEEKKYYEEKDKEYTSILKRII